MQRVKRMGHSLGLIIIRIKGAVIRMVAVEVFPMDVVGEVTHHIVAGIK